MTDTLDLSSMRDFLKSLPNNCTIVAIDDDETVFTIEDMSLYDTEDPKSGAPLALDIETDTVIDENNETVTVGEITKTLDEYIDNDKKAHETLYVFDWTSGEHTPVDKLSYTLTPTRHPQAPTPCVYVHIRHTKRKDTV